MSVEIKEVENNKKIKIKDVEEFEGLLSKTLKPEEESMSISAVEQKDRSLNIGILGVGQAGNKLAKEFYDRGYPVVLVNTAMQDLKLVEVPDRFKLLLDNGIGGSAKDLSVGRAAAEQYAEDIEKMISTHLSDCEVLMLVSSGGGGSGSGASPVMCSLMAKTGKPVVVMYVLPMSSEDTLSKHNAITTLSELTELSKSGVISSLFIVDNVKLESILNGLSLSEFWKTANSAIVEPLHLFNQLSSQASPYVSLDGMEFGKILLSEGCGLYGMTKVDNYEENEGAIAEAVVNNLQSGLLANGFDLSETKSAGVIVVGSKETLKKIPASTLEFAFSMTNKISSEAVRLFRGIYEMETGDSSLRIYSMFGGLGLPKERVEELKSDAEKHMKVLEQKDENKANMTIELSKTKVTSSADQMYNRIKGKSSSMGKLMSGGKKTTDLRRK